MPGAFDDPKFVGMIAKLVAMLGASDTEAANARTLLQRQLNSKGLSVTDLAEYLKSTGSAGAARSAELERDLRRARTAWSQVQQQLENLLARSRMLEAQLHKERSGREEAVFARDRIVAELAAVRDEINHLRSQREPNRRNRIEAVMKAEQGIVQWGWGDNMDERPKYWDVQFETPFTSTPIIQLSTPFLDVGTSDGWTRLGVEVVEADNRRMKIRAEIWSAHNKVAGLKVAWLALGD